MVPYLWNLSTLVSEVRREKNKVSRRPSSPVGRPCRSRFWEQANPWQPYLTSATSRRSCEIGISKTQQRVLVFVFRWAVKRHPLPPFPCSFMEKKLSRGPVEGASLLGTWEVALKKSNYHTPSSSPALCWESLNVLKLGFCKASRIISCPCLLLFCRALLRTDHHV